MGTWERDGGLKSEKHHLPSETRHRRRDPRASGGREGDLEQLMLKEPKSEATC